MHILRMQLRRPRRLKVMYILLHYMLAIVHARGQLQSQHAAIRIRRPKKRK